MGVAGGECFLKVSYVLRFRQLGLNAGLLIVNRLRRRLGWMNRRLK